ncbi:sugar kinase [Halocatena salina]|uniref:Sugar kinase n=1 Tax=Halocatena salina TaxID=2934340 RepID=A0A8U0A3A4_9EURY|nr:sugar kinase [Halocatena salina]UPM42457.1 sugar kinase [Halocatena salina]
METQTDVLTLGETMVLLNPHESGPLRHTMDFRKRIGGAESNVAIGLARLEHQAAWVSRLGADPHGQYVRDTIRGAGVDTQYVTFDSKAPTGIMFKERRELGESGVFYYRDDSAASRMTPDDLPDDALADAKYLHLTGITPALSDSCQKLIQDAIHRANQHDLTVSFDPNLRFKLWDPAEMRETLLPLIEECDVVLPGIEEGEVLLDTEDPETIAEEFRALGATEVIVKLGADGAFVASDSVAQRVGAYEVDRVVDPIGAGDGFAAGYLSGRLDGLSPHRATDRATAVGALATTVTGDIEGLPTRSELAQFTNDRADRLR